MQKLLKSRKYFFPIILSILGLIVVRFFEDFLFNDPFLLFFKGDNIHKALPNFSYVSLVLNYFLRFSLNAILSLLIINTLFNDKKLVQFAGLMYSFFFVILMCVFFILVAIKDNNLNMILFYVRRFIIQPVLLLIFVPAFFYQTAMAKKVQ